MKESARSSSSEGLKTASTSRQFWEPADDMSGNSLNDFDSIDQPASAHSNPASEVDAGLPTDQPSQQEIDRFIAESIAELKLKHTLTKSSITSFLKLFNAVAKKVFNSSLFPDSYYLIEKILGLNQDELGVLIGFTCKQCEDNVLVRKFSKDVRCQSCDFEHDPREIINGDHFFQFDLLKPLTRLLETKPLRDLNSSTNNETISSIFDGDVYKEYLSSYPDKKIIALTLFSDGLQVSSTSSDNLHPIFIRVNDIDSSLDEKTFLYSCYYGSSKPPLDFYVNHLIESLLELFEVGIHVPKLNCKVFPMLTCSIFDTPARAFFLNHAGHSGAYGCTICTIKGKRVDKHFQLYKPEKNAKPRSMEDYESNVLSESNGVKGRSPLSRLPYYDMYRSSPPDGMHAIFGGIAKRLSLSMFSTSFKDKPCFMSSKQRKVLSKRIRKFGRTSEFKRMPRSLLHAPRWKTNEWFQYFFYIAPICLKSLVSDQCYNHLMALIYVTSNLWCGGLPRSTVQSFEELIDHFVSDLEKIYGEHEHTPNAHLITHLVSSVLSFGPLFETNAFFFENLMGKFRKWIKSKFALNDQVRSDYTLKFYLNLSKAKPRLPEQQLSGEFKKKSKIYFKKLIIKKITYTSLTSERKKKNLNYFIRTDDNRFFVIVCFFKDKNGVGWFNGLEFKKRGKLSFSYKQRRLEMDYIHFCELTDNAACLPVSCISTKLHFVPQFKDSKSKTLYRQRGYLIELKHVYHN